MTKKDYELIAYCLFTTNITEAVSLYSINGGIDIVKERENATRKRFAEWFADNLARENPRFDKIKFMKACGVEITHDSHGIER